MPAQPLLSLLFSIEQAVTAISYKHPKLVDKEVEAVYLTYRQFFQDIRQGKDVDDPYSTLARKQDLLDEIWEVLVFREQQQADAQYINGSFRVGDRPVASYEELYVLAFNELRKSVRFWRKRGGLKAYLKHIKEHIQENIGDDRQFYHQRKAEEEVPRPDFTWLAEQHGIQLTLKPNRVLPEDVTEEQQIYYRSFSRNPAAHVERLREVVADLPEYPQLINDLIAALFAAGEEIEAQALADKMVAEHPDYLFGISQYIIATDERERILANAHLLGPNREITDFTPGTDGLYHLTEFLKYEDAAIKVICTEEKYEEAVLRLERLLQLDLPPLTFSDSCHHIALLHLSKLIKADEAGDKDAVPAVPPEVENGAEAVELVRRFFAAMVEKFRG